jgi:hypothetical protein
MAKGQRHDPKREALWRGALAKFGKCGLTVRTFCARERLSEPSFYAWRRIIQKRDAQHPRPAFVPLVVGNEPGVVRESGIVIELRPLGSGPHPLVLRLPAALSMGQVAELVHAIAAGSDRQTVAAEGYP